MTFFCKNSFRYLITLTLGAVIISTGHSANSGHPHTFINSYFDNSKLCKGIRFGSAQDKVYFFRDGVITNTKLNIGELDNSKSEDDDLQITDILLFTRPRLTLDRSSCGNSVCIETEEIKALCPQTKTYRLSVRLDPSFFVPGKFEAEGAFYFYDGDGNEIASDISFIGKIHMPRSDLVASKEQVAKFLTGQSRELLVFIKNTGDRDLRIEDFSEITTLEKMQLTRNECQTRTLLPSQSCALKFEWRSMPAFNMHSNRSYETAFKSNDVRGFGRLLISLKNGADVKFGIWHK